MRNRDEVAPAVAHVPPPRKVSALRRAAPWLVGLGIVVFVITRLPFDAFQRAVGQGPHLALAAMNLLSTIVVLCTDSLSTWIGLVAVGMRRRFTHVFAIRGATYLLFLLNYALGQGGFGFYLHRTGTSSLRAVGATLFLIGTNLATLLIVTAIAWGASGVDPGSETMWWVLVVGCGGLAVYLAVIVAAPRGLAGREVFAPLFEAGLRGHLLAMLGRLPHVIAIVVGHVFAMWAWGVPVPFWIAVTVIPGVVIASVLPISPAGLGTMQAAFVFFFSEHAVGATADERAAYILAFAIVHFVYSVASSLLVGMACMPFARRTGVFVKPAPADASS